MEGTMATIMLFAADFAPKNWAFCNGQILSISQNQALFALLGTTYGGNGTTTFALPDFQGRSAIGSGQGAGRSNFVLGQKAGAQNVTLTVSNLAAHTHPTIATLAATSAAPNTDEGPNNILAGTNTYAAGANGALGGVSEQPTGVTGSSAPVNIQQPYLGLNFVICQYGIFPSRD
ncbi:MAG: tail fiber protein [Saprospiraceae bacterium]|nr:tail fiber protein [Saprospiraceae bacterium]